ncbi:membrane protein acetyltransferase-like protein [Teratosphaeria destructans]|uniref:Membrane protein acetyltransferase-like protein n=1 Tax=Teratosphaeria destructans TaxID=418781 RepID=A0A9W7W3X6_9PEZI|nr:membrane protein acetyltransferase-like protein [Teratosphaeria destructans]
MATTINETSEEHQLQNVLPTHRLLNDPDLPHQRDGQPPAPSTPSGSLSSPVTHLDGLRGSAALMVYMAHWTAYWSADEHRANITKGFGYQSSNYAFSTLPFVRIFFTGGAPPWRSSSSCRGMDGVERGIVVRGLLAAGVRRPVRLFVPVLGVTAGFVALLHAPWGLAPSVHWPEVQGSLWEEVGKWVVETGVVLNPFVNSGPFGRWYPYDPPVWTIAVEFAGSVVVFCLLCLLCYLPGKWRGWVIVLSCVGFLAVYEWAMAMFMAGMLLVYNDLNFLDDVITRRLSKRAQSVLHHILFFAGWWLLSQPTGMGDPEDALSTPGYHLITSLTPSIYVSDNHKYWRFWELPGATLFIYGVLRIKWLQSLLSSRPLRYLGRVSFSFYLIHVLIVWTVGDRIARFFGKVVSGNAGDPMWYDNKFPLPDFGPVGLQFNFVFTQVLFILPLTLLLAEIGTRLLDELSVKMGRWVVERIPWLSGERDARRVTRYTIYQREKRREARSGNADAIAYIERRKALDFWHEHEKRKTKMAHIRRANRGCRLSRTWLWARNLQLRQWKKWELPEDGPEDAQARIGHVEVGSLGEAEPWFTAEEIEEWRPKVEKEMEMIGDEDDDGGDEEVLGRNGGGVAFVDLTDEPDEPEEYTPLSVTEGPAINWCEPFRPMPVLLSLKQRWDCMLEADAPANGWRMEETEAEMGRKALKFAVVEEEEEPRGPFRRAFTSMKVKREERFRELRR